MTKLTADLNRKCKLADSRLSALVITMFATLILVFPGKARAELKIVSVPWQKAETLQSIYAPFVDLLGRKLATTVNLTIAETYQEVGARLQRRTADIGIVGGNTYVEAKETYPQLIYLATCKQPNAYYYSLIITHRNSGIYSLADLAGKSFGYTDIKSTSGYVYPRLMLTSAGLQPDALFSRTYFLNKHDKVYDAVGKGTIDAGGVSITPWDKAVERNGAVYRIIKRSEPIPRNAVIAGGHVSPDLVQQLRVILENAENDTNFAASSTVLKGFLIKDDSFYDIIRRAKTIR